MHTYPFLSCGSYYLVSTKIPSSWIKHIEIKICCGYDEQISWQDELESTPLVTNSNSLEQKLEWVKKHLIFPLLEFYIYVNSMDIPSVYLPPLCRKTHKTICLCSVAKTNTDRFLKPGFSDRSCSRDYSGFQKISSIRRQLAHLMISFSPNFKEKWLFASSFSLSIAIIIRFGAVVVPVPHTVWPFASTYSDLFPHHHPASSSSA